LSLPEIGQLVLRIVIATGGRQAKEYSVPAYKFRSDNNRPEGVICPIDLDLRVLASLKDMEAAGIAAQYEWHSAHVGMDQGGDFVLLEIEWPEGTLPHAARPFIERQFVTIEWPPA
jgi:hypothetical protein